jgi:hypothetical protein
VCATRARERESERRKRRATNHGADVRFLILYARLPRRQGARRVAALERWPRPRTSPRLAARAGGAGRAPCRLRLAGLAFHLII